MDKPVDCLLISSPHKGITYLANKRGFFLPTLLTGYYHQHKSFF